MHPAQLIIVNFNSPALPLSI